jgi:hypothetical protein
MVNCPLKLGQTCSLRDRYRETYQGNTRYGYSCRPGHSRGSYRRSTNFFVPYGTTLVSATSDRARNIVGSWNIGTSRQSSRRWK